MEISNACSKMRSDAIAAYIQQVPLLLTLKRSPARRVSSCSAVAFVSSPTSVGDMSAMNTSACGSLGLVIDAGTESAAGPRVVSVARAARMP